MTVVWVKSLSVWDILSWRNWSSTWSWDDWCNTYRKWHMCACVWRATPTKIARDNECFRRRHSGWFRHQVAILSPTLNSYKEKTDPSLEEFAILCFPTVYWWSDLKRLQFISPEANNSLHQPWLQHDDDDDVKRRSVIVSLQVITQHRDYVSCIKRQAGCKLATRTLIRLDNGASLYI